MTDSSTAHEVTDRADHAETATSDRTLVRALTLGPVRLQVSELARSLTYYTDVIGLRVTSRTGDTATLATEDGLTPLVQLTARKNTNPVLPHSRLGLYHFALLLPDRPALGRFVSHLARNATRMGASDHLVSEAIYLRDPDGLGIEVYADRPRESWRTSNGQFEMATAPLDTDAVMAAGADAPWTGLPAGTVMGHVHLHVGDLADASHFYHGILGLDRTVWGYPGALFLSAGGYHHHLAVNTWAGLDAPSASEHDARLLEWQILLPAREDALAAAHRLTSVGHAVSESERGWIVRDPWGTPLLITAA